MAKTVNVHVVHSKCGRQILALEHLEAQYHLERCWLTNKHPRSLHGLFESESKQKEHAAFPEQNSGKVVASLMEAPGMVTKQEAEAPSIPWTISTLPVCMLS